MEVYSVSDLPCAQAYSHFLEVQSKFSRYESRNLRQKAFLAIRVVLSDRAQLNCSVTAAISQHLKVGNCAAKLLPRASKAAPALLQPTAT